MDKNIVKEIFKENDYSLVFVKSGQVILTSRDSGIKPLYNIIKNDREEFINSSVSDKVVGKGAAIIYDLLGISYLYAEVISDPAREFLKNKNIEIEYNINIPNIMNRNQTDLCPIEKISQAIGDKKDFIEELDKFFTK